MEPLQVPAPLPSPPGALRPALDAVAVAKAAAPVDKDLQIRELRAMVSELTEMVASGTRFRLFRHSDGAHIVIVFGEGEVWTVNAPGQRQMRRATLAEAFRLARLLQEKK